LKTRITSRSSIPPLPKLPALEGLPIRIEFRPNLTALRGKLLSGDGRGTPVFAGSFLRRRLIVLDSGLQKAPRQLARILVHELFHFVWLRLGNPLRKEYGRLVRNEFDRRVRGELGWSAEWRKEELRDAGVKRRDRRWREYACESFCDTAGYLYSGIGAYGEGTLSASAREGRRRWFAQLVSTRGALRV
jgi:hypothetical protein